MSDEKDGPVFWRLNDEGRLELRDKFRDGTPFINELPIEHFAITAAPVKPGGDRGEVEVQVDIDSVVRLTRGQARWWGIRMIEAAGAVESMEAVTEASP